MDRSSRTVFVLTLGGCFLLLAAARSTSLGEEPAGTPTPAVEAQKAPALVPPGAAAATAPSKDAPAEKKEKAEAKPEDEKKTDETPKPAPEPTLSKEMTELRDRLRQATAACSRFPFNTRDNTPREIMDFCLAYGCFAEVTDASTGKKVNGVGALSWNYSCGGYELFMAGTKDFVPRIGYGVQRRPGEFLAFLAMSMVNPDYELRVGDHHGTVVDLIDYEKQTCRSGIDLCGKLIGLAYYVPEAEATWQNQAKETWSVERLVREELARTPNASTHDVTDRLLALAFAVQRRTKCKLPIEGPFRQAQDHVREYQQYALNLQNADGTWNAEFFALKGNSNDLTGTLLATGRILEWLVFSLSDQRLQEPELLRSVSYVANLLATRAPSWNLATMTPRDINAVMHAVRALSTYDQRVLRPDK